MNIKDIKISKRIRKDMGNLKELVDSINGIGLLHPIVINENSELICGRRRLEALRLIGINDLIVGTHYRIFNVEDVLKGEFEENFCRKDFTPSEAVEIWDATESFQKTGKKKPEGVAESARRSRVAKSLGVGKDWLREAKTVKDSGRDDLIEEMDKGNISVHKAYEELEKNRTPDPVYVNFDTYNKIVKGSKTQISKNFGNWKKGDTVELRIANASTLDILEMDLKQLKDYTNEDAIREGFKNLNDMKKIWKEEGLEWEENKEMVVLKINTKK